MGAKLIYGGSFNPVHMAHMRMAIECRERMAAFTDGLDFLPSAVPPHKTAEGMLPFALRVEMLNAAIADFPHFACNEEEARRFGPSYTYETLAGMGAKGAQTPFFLLGSQDFALLGTWHKGLRLPEVCNLVIVPRAGHNMAAFMAISRKLWPDAKPGPKNPDDSCMGEAGYSLALPGRNNIYWLDVPQMDISASRIRRLWLCGRSLDFLMPTAALHILNREERAVRACWGKSASC